MVQPPPNADRLFNNADSFAQVFDEAWHRLGPGTGEGPTNPEGDNANGPGGEPDQRLQRVLAQLADHPFAQANPQLARQVGEFRIRLLGL